MRLPAANERGVKKNSDVRYFFLTLSIFFFNLGRGPPPLRVKYKIDFIFDSKGGGHPFWAFRVKYKIDFIFDPGGGPPPFRVKYKIDFIFDSEGWRTPSWPWPLAMAMAPGPWSLVHGP